MNKPILGPFNPPTNALIVDAFTCYRACRALSPDNPLAVAEGLSELVEACRRTISFLQDLVGRPRIGADLEDVLSDLETALAKIGVHP